MDWFENIVEIESLVKAKATCYCSQSEKKIISIKKTKETL